MKGVKKSRMSKVQRLIKRICSKKLRKIKKKIDPLNHNNILMVILLLYIYIKWNEIITN